QLARWPNHRAAKRSKQYRAGRTRHQTTGRLGIGYWFDRPGFAHSPIRSFASFASSKRNVFVPTCTSRYDGDSGVPTTSAADGPEIRSFVAPRQEAQSNVLAEI